MSGAARVVALVCTGDDPNLGERLRAAVWRGLVPTVFLRGDDIAGRRLAVAAGAQTGSIWPDSSGCAVLVQGAAAAGATTIDRPLVLDGAPPGAPDGSGRVWRIVGTKAPWDDRGDGLAIRAWEIGRAHV